DSWLNYRDSKIVSRKWEYRDRTDSNSLLSFVFGRRLRKAQSDSAQRFFCLYFDGLERVNGFQPVKGRALIKRDDAQAAVLIDSADGNIVWSLGRLPIRPVCWNQDATLIAVQIEKNEIQKYRRGAGNDVQEKVTKLAVGGVTDFHFIEDGLLAKTPHGDVKWDVRKEVPTASAVEKKEARPVAEIHDFRKSTAPEQNTLNINLTKLEENWQNVEADGELILRVPDGFPGPIVALSFDVLHGSPDESSTEFSRYAYLRFGPKSDVKGDNAYLLDDISPKPRHIRLYIPLAIVPGRSLAVVAPSDRSIEIGNVKWSNSDIQGSRAMPVAVKDIAKQLGVSEEPSDLDFSIRRPLFLLRARNSLGTVKATPFSATHKAKFFDGDLTTPVWKTPEGLMGWTLEIEFGSVLELEGVVVTGVPGRLSSQAEGVAVETWDAESKRWTWLKSESGLSQFHHGVFKRTLTTRARVSAICREKTLSEILVFARKPVEKTTLDLGEGLDLD
ncbi:MAG: hypothetical protein QF886_06285, partial [Planctomycetota bacterium]|nr:hypothetical protein [Planctomycetota bacterium]